MLRASLTAVKVLENERVVTAKCLCVISEGRWISWLQVLIMFLFSKWIAAAVKFIRLSLNKDTKIVFEIGYSWTL